MNIKLQDVIECKKICPFQYRVDLLKLDAYDANNNLHKLCGNKIVYHHQIENIMKTTARNQKSFYEVMLDDDLRQTLLEDADKRNTGKKVDG